MPPKPLFESEAARSAAITTVMITTLAMSLVLAYALTVVQPGMRVESVADLTLNVPDTWSRRDEASALPGLDESVVFTDPSDTGRVLRVASVARRKLRVPLIALNQMLNSVLPAGARQGLEAVQPVTPMRAGTAVGVMFVGVGESGLRANAHLVAVLTEDARWYRVMYLSHQGITERNLADVIGEDIRLFKQMIAGAVLGGSRSPGDSDFAAAGLSYDGQAIQVPDGLTARIPQTGQPVAIRLIPELGEARFQCLRVLGTADSGVTDAAHPLSPVSLLSRRYADAVGRPLDSRGLWFGQIKGISTWRVSMLTSDGSLLRQLWYLRPRPGYGLLIELVCEPMAARGLSRWVVPLAEAVSAALPADGVEASTESVALKQAIDRGDQITRRQWERLGQYPMTDWSYYLIRAGERSIGFEVHQRRPPDPGDSFPLRGRGALLFSHGTEQIGVDQIWRASTDGSGFTVTYQRTRQNFAKGTRGEPTITHLEQQAGRLALTRLAPKPEEEVWAGTAPPGLVAPMAEQNWPVPTDPSWDAGPALIWMCQGDRPPQPFWAHLAAATGDEDSNRSPAERSTAAAHLTLRPMMSTDVDRYALDENGDVISYESFQPRSAFGGEVLRYRRVDRPSLFAEYPSLEPQLDRWQQGGE